MVDPAQRRFKRNFMGKIIHLCLAISFGFLPAFSQNLVPNGGFESNTSCPEEKGQIELAENWTSPNMGNPDYFHECYSTTNPIVMRRDGAGIPVSYMGISKTHNGKAMAGFYLHKVENGLVPWKEYLQIKLNSKVKKKRDYCFKAYVKLSEFSNYATSNFEVVLSKSRINEDHAFTIREEAHLKLDSGNFLNLKNQWMQICLPLPAQKSARYLTIGNFQPVDFTDKLVVAPRSFKERENFAYYYIDDISLEEVSNLQECDCENSYDYRTHEQISADSFSLPLNEPLIIENIEFAVDSSHFEVIDEEQIYKILEILKNNPTFYLSLVGYTDDSGDKKHNFDLSLARAQAVKTYLSKKGIEEDRIFCNGLGDAFPLASNADIEGRSHNRRVEFTILRRIPKD